MKFKDYITCEIEKDCITRDKYLSLCDCVFINYKLYSRFLQEKKNLNITSEPYGIVACSNLILDKLPKFDGKVISVWEDKSITKSIQNPLYATNVDTIHKSITSVPIGRDWRSIDVYESFDESNEKNNKLLYINFAHSTNSKRSLIYNLFESKSWCTSVKVEQWLKYPISRLQFFKDLYNHKFVLCPEGNGIDTFRLWDSLYMKCIPITTNSIHINNFPNLPIVKIDDYSIITEEFLNDTYSDILNKDYDFDLLKFEHWKQIILK